MALPWSNHCTYQHICTCENRYCTTFCAPTFSSSCYNPMHLQIYTMTSIVQSFLYLSIFRRVLFLWHCSVNSPVSWLRSYYGITTDCERYSKGFSDSTILSPLFCHCNTENIDLCSIRVLSVKTATAALSLFTDRLYTSLCNAKYFCLFFNNNFLHSC